MPADRFDKHYPCLHCGSSDGVGLWTNGRGKCFVCNKPAFIDQYDGSECKVYRIKDKEPTVDINSIQTFPSTVIADRNITLPVVEHFKVKMGYNDSGKVSEHYYPYTYKKNIVAYKKRTLPKSFSVIGDIKHAELFGQNEFQSGGRLLVITEGELDTLAVAQANLSIYKRIYPVVSLPSSNGMKTLLNSREWVRSFERVILMLDQDEPGQKAIEEAAKIIGWDKTYVATLQEKDPSDELLKHGAKAIIQSIFGASKYTPASVVQGEDIWKAFQSRKNTVSVPYPTCLSGLNTKLEGMRKGEIVLFTSGTGSGKSTMIKEIILHLLDETEDNIGLVSLEESIGDTAGKFISMLTPEGSSEDQERKAFEKIFMNHRLSLLDHNGSVSDSSLIDQIENLCLLGCQYIVLDHITIAVSEGADGKTGNEAIDAVMSDLLKIVKKHNVWLGVISHLRKSQSKSFEEGQLSSIDDIKGSGSIKQISFDIVTFSRNLVAEHDSERNRIYLRVLKARFTGNTGDCGSAYYDPKTKRLRPQEDFAEYHYERDY